jgi:hypothetical protein
MAEHDLLSLRGRLGIQARLARENTTDMTRAARSAAQARFAMQVDPNHELPAAERSRRAYAAQRAHMARLAIASAKARRERAGQAARLQQAEASENFC